jgi:response regulator RpfG family c-di-GMP phosphodiesterase
MNQLQERHVVVLVDDGPGILSALVRSLRKEPYQLLATSSPAQAIRWIQYFDVSAIVSDQRMPDMTGLELLEQISARSPVTARIILTAFPGPTVQEPRLRQSIECVIAKPWDDDMLRRTVREFLRERELEDPSPGGLYDRLYRSGGVRS